MPCDVKPGIYVFYIESKYEGMVTTSSATFEVLKEPRDIIGYIINVQTIMIILISVINLFIIIALRDIILKFRKRKEEEMPSESVKPEKGKELKEKKPKEVLEEPKKVEEVEKKKGRASDLIKNIRKIRERLR